MHLHPFLGSPPNQAAITEQPRHDTAAATKPLPIAPSKSPGVSKAEPAKVPRPKPDVVTQPKPLDPQPQATTLLAQLQTQPFYEKLNEAYNQIRGNTGMTNFLNLFTS